MTSPLLGRPGVIAGGAAAATATACTASAVAVLAVAAAAGHDAGHSGHGLWNDFYSYWGAGRVLNEGGNPYDQDELRAVYARGGVHPEVGSGYSYPLLLAQLVRPLSLLPAGAAGVVFTVVSLAALWMATALLVGSLPGVTTRRAMVWGVLIGLAPPVSGSLYVGQVNLLLMVPLTVAYRCVMPAPMVGVAAAVKLFPATALAPFLFQGGVGLRRLARGAAVLVALLAVPSLLSPHAVYAGRLSELIAPDPYWTNVSLNGLLSRLAVPFDGIDPPLRGLPVGITDAILSCILGAAVLVVLARSRGRPWNLCFALSLVVGVIIAPKNSIWNYAPLVLCVVAVWPHLTTRHRRACLWAALALVAVGSIGVFITLLPGPPAVVRIWLASAALLGALVLAGLLALLLLTKSPPMGPPGPSGRSH